MKEETNGQVQVLTLQLGSIEHIHYHTKWNNENKNEPEHTWEVAQTKTTRVKTTAASKNDEPRYEVITF